MFDFWLSAAGVVGLLLFGVSCLVLSVAILVASACEADLSAWLLGVIGFSGSILISGAAISWALWLFFGIIWPVLA